jgi:CubicO group peptidase (beta-lactamase class C family)
VKAYPSALQPETIMRLFPLVLVLLALAAPAARAQTAAPDFGASVDRYIQPLVDLDVFSGVVLVARGDSVVASRAYGLAVREFGVPLEVDHAFRIASLSKPFTRALVGRLAEKGALGIDDPLDRWLPDFPSADRITLRQLLDHQAGVPSVNSLPFDEESPVPNTLDQLVDSIARLPLDFEPGSDTRYSNGGYAVLGLVLEKASGMPYERLLETEILEPLELTRTGHEADGEVVPQLARGYMPSPAEFGAMRRAPFQGMATKTGGGSLTSTAGDLHRWALAIGRDPILRPETWADLFPRADFLNTGRCPGYNVALAREGEWIAVVLANNYAAGAAMDVAPALIALARGDRPEPLPVVSPAPLAPADRAAVEGDYAVGPGPALPPGTVVTIESRGDDLVATVFGGPVDVLVPQGDRAFLLRGLWSRATFDPPDGGRSPGIEVQPLYGMASYRAERVEEAGR